MLIFRSNSSSPNIISVEEFQWNTPYAVAMLWWSEELQSPESMRPQTRPEVKHHWYANTQTLFMTKNCHILERFQTVKCLVGHQTLNLPHLEALNRKERCQMLEQGQKHYYCSELGCFPQEKIRRHTATTWLQNCFSSINYHHCPSRIFVNKTDPCIMKQ